ncbi:hypothetical protein [Erysipelothrix piscisicarius]|uniref:hypothetical protein n=1 Tax=Erysipelothrix piscisicarius TaxID=2485784 RepID=UPI001E4CE592|nr:hypothetical protein [Erysipelothrix piscisicarius]
MNQKLMKFKNIIVLIAVINFTMLTIVRVILYSELHLVYRSHFKMFLYLYHPPVDLHGLFSNASQRL